MKRLFRVGAVLLAVAGLGHAQNLYVSRDSFTSVVQLDGRTGASLGVFASGGGLAGTEGVTFGPDGNLYVASFNTNQVLKYDGDTGAFLSAFVSASSGGLTGPTGVTFGPDGNLYVASFSMSQVLKYDGSTGAFISAFVPTGSGGLANPFGLTFGPDGNLYVASFNSNQVLKYDGSTGAPLGTFASGGGLIRPFDVIFGPDGNLYVSSGTNQVLKYSGSTGAFLSVFVTTGSGGLAAAGGIAFGPDGNLYVASSGTNQVLKYSGSTGAFLSVFGTVVAAPTFLTFRPVVPDAYQVRYAANLAIGDSVINFSNSGASSSVAGIPGAQNGDICANVYAYSPDEQLVSCCSCNVTPNALNSLSVKNDLASNTLTPIIPSALVIKVLVTKGGEACTASSAATVTRANLAPGLLAWGSTIHELPGTYGLTETPFAVPRTLTPAELTRMTQLCAFIRANGSGYGICKSCKVGGLGAASK